MIANWFAQTYLADVTDLVPGTNLFNSSMPDIDNAVCIYNESGPSEGYQNEYASDTVGINVHCRGTDAFVTEYSWKIHFAVVNLTDQFTDNFYLRSVRIQQTPEQIDIDAKGRREVFAHYHVLINHLEAGNRQPLVQLVLDDNDNPTTNDEDKMLWV